MKTTFKFIIAAMAAISVFSSCQKELVGEVSNNTDDGIRTIAVQFDNSTKATLDGFTPKFANGDAIRVSNTEKSEECTVSVDGSGNATFTTTLSGALTAIYPADAAVLSPDGEKPIVSPYFNVSASQDGTIAKAIIAKAEITAESTSATFNVQTALFQITPPTGVKTFTITSLKPVVDGVARTGNAKAINTDGQNDDDKCVITVSNSDSTTFYVALVPGVNLSDLSFEYITDATNGFSAMKGIPAKDITAAGKTDATAANTKYTIGNTNWHPYVTIGVKKWATMNIGATSATEAGKYFAWGDIVGQTPSSFIFSTSFNWAHAPFNNGQSSYDEQYFASVKDTECPGGILALKNDAANANWGGSWRMPTSGELEALISVKEWDSTNKGYKFGTSPNQIFLPAAGYGIFPDLYNVGGNGFYWSSSLVTGSPDCACYLFFADAGAGTGYYSRYYGQSVRALSE